MGASRNGKAGAAGARSGKDEDSCCSRRCKAACLSLCCCLFSIVAVLGGGVGVLYIAFEDPVINVTDARISQFSVSSNGLAFTINMAFDATLHIENPSSQPVKFMARDVKLRLISLDKDAPDGVGDAYAFGTAASEGDFEVPPQSATDVPLSLVVSSNDVSAGLVLRLAGKDCPSSGKTKVRVEVEQVVILLYGIDMHFDDVLVTDYLMDCAVP